MSVPRIAESAIIRCVQDARYYGYTLDRLVREIREEWVEQLREELQRVEEGP